jgi:hypothetical protein
MVAELQARGWSRFTQAQLEKYLDWALQDVYSKAPYDRSTISVFTAAGTELDNFTFTSIGGTAESINEVMAVYYRRTNTDPVKVRAATDKEFMDVIWPNTQTANPHRGAPVMYYVFDLAVLLYPKPQPAMDVYIHHMLREDIFTSGSDVTSLPERFDKAIIALAEVHCNRRSHNYEDMSAAQLIFDEFLLAELGQSASTMGERVQRVQPWVS